MDNGPQFIDQATRDYLLSLKERGVVLGLDRMRAFVEALGNPHDRVPIIHVAGTNGKGSVAAMLEAILRAAGWKTGLYTSPHLVRLGERIQIDRVPLSHAELAHYVAELRPAVERRIQQAGSRARPSYFEFVTALALTHFARVHCDVAVVEVGMGGRLDATNVVTPELSVITSIGLDHSEFLGNTVSAIAAEKAGIIKAVRPVVIGRLPAEAERVVRGVAAHLDASVVSVVERFGADPALYPRTNLPGDFQRLNAATAVLAAEQLGARWKIAEVNVAKALARLDWPARWQSVEVGGRRVIVDASHNAEGAEALDRNLASLTAETHRKPIIVVGVLGAARAKPLLDVVARHAAEIHLVVPRQARACRHDELQALIPGDFHGVVVHDTVEAIFPAVGQCLPDRAKEEVVVVTGSIYLAGEVLVAIDPARGPLEGELQDF